MTDFYIQSTNSDDLPQVHDIFVHYVNNSTISFYDRPPSLSIIESKLTTATERGLPFLSAIETTPTDYRSNGTEEQDGDSNKKVLGYAYALPFRQPLLSYAPSVELSIFVHPSYVQQGIGTRLLRGLLEELKTAVHRAVEPGYGDRARNVPIRNVIVIMAHDVNGVEREDGDRLLAWYRGFGFKTVARLKNVGFKFGRWVDTVYLQLDLGEKIAKD